MADISAVIGKRLGLSVMSVPQKHFGALGPIFSMDQPSSCAHPRKMLGGSLSPQLAQRFGTPAVIKIGAMPDHSMSITATAPTFAGVLRAARTWSP